MPVNMTTEHAKARTEICARLMQMGDEELIDLYLRVVHLTEQEATRLAVERCELAVLRLRDDCRDKGQLTGAQWVDYAAEAIRKSCEARGDQ